MTLPKVGTMDVWAFVRLRSQGLRLRHLIKICESVAYCCNYVKDRQTVSVGLVEWTGEEGNGVLGTYSTRYFGCAGHASGTCA